MTRFHRLGSDLWRSVFGTRDDEVSVAYTLSYVMDGGPEPVASNATLTTTATATIGGATQNSLSMTVAVTWSGGGTRPGFGPSNTNLDGWTSGGWSTSGSDAYVCTFTKASAAVGSTGPTFTVNSGVSAGTITVSSSGGSTEVPDATDTNDAITVQVADTLQFAISRDKTKVKTDETVTHTITATVGGSTQTNIEITVSLEVTGMTGVGGKSETLGSWTKISDWAPSGESEAFQQATFRLASGTVGAHTFTIGWSNGASARGNLIASVSAGESDQVASGSVTYGTDNLTTPKYHWTLDAPSGSNVGIPQTTQEWDDLIAWAGLTIGRPDSLWKCQEASGNLADSFGSTTMTASTGTLAYLQTVTGWARGGVQCDDNSGTEWLQFSGVNLSTTRDAAFFVVDLNTLGSRTLWSMGGTDPGSSTEVRINGSGNIIAFRGGNTATSASTYSGVVCIMAVCDPTASTFKVYVKPVGGSMETLTPTWAAPANSTDTCYVLSGWTATTDATLAWAERWTGANADIDATEAAALFTARGI